MRNSMLDNKDMDKKFYFLGIIPVIWLSLLIAPFVHLGLLGIMNGMSEAMETPFKITLCNDSLRTILIMIGIYILAILMYDSSKKEYRRNEEHGSAKWGSPYTLNKKYEQTPKEANKILTKNVSIGLDGKKHQRNLNTLIIGGSGAGKTRSFVFPNIMQLNKNYIVLDSKGEILKNVGHLLEEAGYEIKVIDLINIERSNCYNPFFYIQNESDIQKMITNLFKSTTPKDSVNQDKFWEDAAEMFAKALGFYIDEKGLDNERNFTMMNDLIRAGQVKEDDEDYVSILDILMNRLEEQDPNNIALKYYRSYHSGSSKTLKSIQITLASKLEKFNLESVSKMTSSDELELNKFGEKKMALFAIIPDNDTSLNFLISILYTQIFQELFYLADYKYGGTLPIPVEFIMDEFANVCLPDDFEKILSVMRSRGISVSIILQNLAQLKALFEKQWESIVGNCDELLYLGGNEQATHEYISKLLGKSTIHSNSYGKSTGRGENYSTNDQTIARDLLSPDEIRKLNNSYALLFIRGEAPIKDYKYDLRNHPNYKFTGFKTNNLYIHGKDKLQEIEKDKKQLDPNQDDLIDTKDEDLEKYSSYVILNNDELEEYLKEVQSNEKS